MRWPNARSIELGMNHKIRLSPLILQVQIVTFKCRVFFLAPLHFSSCTPTSFKNTEIILYSFGCFQNTDSVCKLYFWNRKSRRQKIILEHIFCNTFLFISGLRIDKSIIHKTCSRKGVMEIFRK